MCACFAGFFNGFICFCFSWICIHWCWTFDVAYYPNIYINIYTYILWFSWCMDRLYLIFIDAPTKHLLHTAKQIHHYEWLTHFQSQFIYLSIFRLVSQYSSQKTHWSIEILLANLMYYKHSMFPTNFLSFLNFKLLIGWKIVCYQPLFKMIE